MDVIPISRLAKSAGISAAALRYYEQLGLIQSQSRRRGAPRQFPQETLRRLRAIAALQDLGFTLKEILKLLRGSGSAGQRSRLLGRHLRLKLRQVEGELRLNERLKRKLGTALQDCLSPQGAQGRLAHLLGISKAN